jgi:hypothetical protein
MNQVIFMAEKSWEMQPLGPLVTDEVQKNARKKAIREFLETARECELEPGQINAQLRYFNAAVNADDLMTPLALAELLYLRCKHDRVTLEECQKLPTAELLKHQREILGLPSLEEDEEELLLLLGIKVDDGVEKAQKRVAEVLEALAKKKGGGGAAAEHPDLG